MLNEKEKLSNISYKVIKISGVQLEEDTIFDLNHDQLDSVFVDAHLNTVTIYVKTGVHFNEAVPAFKEFMHQFLLGIILHSNVIIDSPEYREVSRYQREDSIVSYSSNITVQSSYSAVHIYNGAKLLNHVIETGQTRLNSNNKLLYRRLYSIMKNSNRIVKFMALYEFLLDVVSKGKAKKEQRNVGVFIKSQNLHKRSDKISFHTTRRKNKNFQEDIFTYYRNEIAHAEFENNFTQYERLAQNIDNQIIKQLIVLIDVAIKVNNNSLAPDAKFNINLLAS